MRPYKIHFKFQSSFFIWSLKIYWKSRKERYNKLVFVARRKRARGFSPLVAFVRRWRRSGKDCGRDPSLSGGKQCGGRRKRIINRKVSGRWAQQGHGHTWKKTLWVEFQVLLLSRLKFQLPIFKLKGLTKPILNQPFSQWYISGGNLTGRHKKKPYT